MITNKVVVQDFDDELLQRKPVDYGKNLHRAEARYEEARLLGVLPSKDPPEGIDGRFGMARTLNGIH